MAGLRLKPENTEFLPYGRQSIDQDDIDAVVEVLRGEFLTTGPAVKQFEEAFAQKVGSAHAAACSNGTAALHLASLALGLKEGDEVIVPTVTFLATANGPHYTGAGIVFADVDPTTGLMMPEHLEEAIARSTPGKARAVFSVHLNGQSADPAGIRGLAEKYGLKVVEDCCHAAGASYRHEASEFMIGGCAHADLAIFSFHPVKTITSGEGGMVTGNDDALIDCVRRFRNHGMNREPDRFQSKELAFDETGAPNPWYYEMCVLGFNYRLSDIQCALGSSQLKKLDLFNAKRAELVAEYRRLLSGLESVVRPVPQITSCNPAWHLFVVQIDFTQIGISRSKLMQALHQAGIGTQVHYLPVHKQPYYRDLNGDLDLPGAERYYERCLSLPLFPEMATDDVGRVVDALKRQLQ